MKIDRIIQEWWQETYGNLLTEEECRKIDQMISQYGYIGASIRNGHNPLNGLIRFNKEFLEKERLLRTGKNAPDVKRILKWDEVPRESQIDINYHLFEVDIDNNKLTQVRSSGLDSQTPKECYEYMKYISKMMGCVDMYFKLQPGASGKDMAEYVKNEIFPDNEIFFYKVKSSDFEKAYFNGDYIKGEDL